eukprot:evm.model.scf_39.6 EVM.evm.TU.scf_39.6   scf_39:44866-46137(-)
MYGDGHSNVYVKNLPSAVDEPTLKNLFQPYGTITSCRVMRTRNPAGHNFGFVRFGTVQEAMAAIETMNGAQVGDLVIEVKFADSDVNDRGSKAGGQGGGEDLEQSPSDNLYVRGFPGTYTENDIQTMFSAIGTIVECRVLHSKEAGRSGVALVRMSSVLEAGRAIEMLNGQTPAGCGEPLLVKYADTAADKERKAKRRQSREPRFNPYQKPEAAGAAAAGAGIGKPVAGGGIPGQPQSYVNPLAANGGGQLPQFGLQGFAGDQALNALALQNPGALLAANLGGPEGAALNQFVLPNPGLLGVQPQAGMGSFMPNGVGGATGGAAGAPGGQDGSLPISIYVRNLPVEADKLYMYEKFAPYGAVSSVKLLTNDAGEGRGVGFVNYLDNQSAVKAVAAMNGTKVGEKSLLVALQAQRKDRKPKAYY